jgi:hypothetical protein
LKYFNIICINIKSKSRDPSKMWNCRDQSPYRHFPAATPMAHASTFHGGAGKSLTPIIGRRLLPFTDQHVGQII